MTSARPPDPDTTNPPDPDGSTRDAATPVPASNPEPEPETTAASNVEDLRAGAADADRPATVAEMAEAALDVAAGAVTAIGALANRVAVLEQPGRGRGEKRSDFRFEAYPATDREKDLHAQLRRARNAWQRLTEWVDWLVATYRLTTVIPPCWAEHPTVVEEVAGLRVAWVAAWLDGAAADAVLAFHERLYRAATRLNDGNWGKPRCDGDHHESGLDNPDTYESWLLRGTRTAALVAARDRTFQQIRLGHREPDSDHGDHRDHSRRPRRGRRPANEGIGDPS